MLFALVGLNWAAIELGFVTLPPNSVPWQPPKLAAPPGYFAHLQMQRLRHDRTVCLAALDRAPGLSYAPLADKTEDAGCGFDNVVLATRTPIAFNTAPVATCALTAALYWWQGALKAIAARELHTTIRRIDQIGTYECRNVNSQKDGARSEHASANAIDIEAFETADGRRITIAGDWGKPSDAGRFLRAARDAACGVFGEVLSPQYNLLHASHFHLDEAAWQICS
ncbi:MAG: extensin family protein [Rhizomicrobium sp.]